MANGEPNALTKTAGAALATPDYGIDVGRVIAMRAAVEEVVAKVLRRGEHYGEIPGTTKEGERPKMTLLQPGAEVLSQVFRLRPEYEEMALIEREDFVAVKIRCRLYHSLTGELVGEAIGSANTREEKYVAQTSARICPACGKPTIFKSKEGGWFCWAKKNGCGAQFPDGDKRMVQDQGAVVNSAKVWGLYHTLESIAQKRAFVRATRTATATSDLFTDEEAVADEDEERGAPGKQTSVRRAETPAPKPARATPVQIRDLREALDSLEVGVKAAAELKNGEREKVLNEARLAWINGMLISHEQAAVKAFIDLTPNLATRLTEAARNGEMPPAGG
jgi:ribosomal protein L37AE/L43A